MPAKRKINILITAGPTREPIDPVRFISNYSTGEMGYCIAEEAVKRKHRVTLISGPVERPLPKGIRVSMVETAKEMLKAVEKEIDKNECIIMAAAVGDLRPVEKGTEKIKKKEKMTLKLTRTKDILEKIKDKELVKIGFALETGELKKRAAKKLKRKKLHMIIANKKSSRRDPFGPGKKDFMIIYKDKKAINKRGITKKKMAAFIVDGAERIVADKAGNG